MALLLRAASLVVISFLLLGMAIAIGSPETGPLEKAGLLVVSIVLLLAASAAWRIGEPHPGELR